MCTSSDLSRLYSLRLYPNAEHIDKEAEEDDVIPLRYPVQTRDGQTLTSIKVQKGQVTLAVRNEENPYLILWPTNRFSTLILWRSTPTHMCGVQTETPSIHIGGSLREAWLMSVS